MTELSATSAEPAYLNRLALKHLPFSNVMPNGSFYDGSHIKQRRLLLQHLLRATRRPVCLHAAAGAGKTALISQLQLNANSDLRFCSFPLLEDERLCCQQVLEQFGAEDQVPIFESDLQQYLGQLRRLNITPVLIVDDLASIKEHSRERLVNWLSWQNEQGQPLWQAIVCSQTKATLAETDFQFLDVPPLELSEIGAYLSQRLSAAGYHDDLPFNDSVIRRFYRLSSGNPAKLNHLAHQHLLLPVRQRQWSFQLPGLMQHVGRWSAAVVLILVIVLVLIYQQDINQWVASQSIENEPLSIPEVIEPAEVKTVIAGEPEEQDLDAPRQELADLLAEIPSAAKNDVAEIARIEPKAEAKLSEIHAETDASVHLPEPAVDNKVTTVIEPSVDTKLEVNIGKGTAWILQQKPVSYTFQLMGSWDENEVDEFIDKNALSVDYARFTSLRDGKPWHVLIYGVYESKKAALKASNEWPAPMNTLPNWLRRFDSVQNQIKEKGVKP